MINIHINDIKKNKVTKAEIVSQIEGMFHLIYHGKDKSYLNFASNHIWRRSSNFDNGSIRVQYADMRNLYTYKTAKLIRSYIYAINIGRKIRIPYYPFGVMDKAFCNVSNELLAMMPKELIKHTKFMKIPRSHAKGVSQKDRYLPYFCIDIYQKREEDIKLLEADNMCNMVPVMLCFDLNRKNLKKLLGKGLWKTLLKNSLKKNEILCQKIFARSARFDKKDSVTLLKKFISLDYISPDISLNGGYGYVCMNLLDYNDTSKSNKVKIKECEEIILDTFRMFKAEKRSVCLDWSLKRIYKEHDKVQHDITMKSLGDSGGDMTLEFKSVKNINDDNLPDGCEVLRDGYSLALEGLSMGHCVASYVDECRNGECVIVKVEEPRATVEFNLKELKFGQVQGKRTRKAPQGIDSVLDELKPALIEDLLKSGRVNPQSTNKK